MSQSWQQFIDSITPGSTDTTGLGAAPPTQDAPGVGFSAGGGMPAGAVFQIPNADGTVTYYDASGNPVGTGPGTGTDTTGSPGSSGSSTYDTSGLNAPTGGAPSGLGSLLSGLGGTGGLGALAALIPALSGLYSANQTGKATGQVTQGITNAQTAVSKLLGGTTPYAPYTAAGTQALTNLGGMNWNPINFGPLGGRPVTLGAIAAPPAASTKGK